MQVTLRSVSHANWQHTGSNFKVGQIWLQVISISSSCCKESEKVSSLTYLWPIHHTIMVILIIHRPCPGIEHAQHSEFRKSWPSRNHIRIYPATSWSSVQNSLLCRLHVLYSQPVNIQNPSYKPAACNLCSPQIVTHNLFTCSPQPVNPQSTPVNLHPAVRKQATP